ncbi:MAG: hypothetical protein CENE_01846 [Candidatus Celerinatantimonas neptuna]|nr:MAG: hypothetical protein CENE_01846 [Candidatus Celerinatantimonas neptuna]
MVDIKLQPVQHETMDELFEVFKCYMRPVLEDVLGWDEAFQKDGFYSYLQHEWFYWMTLDDRRVGLVCHKMTEDSVHIHLLVVFSELQRQGLATQVMRYLRDNAHRRYLPLTLSCFKTNEQAQLYQKQGSVVTSQDEHFYKMSCF